MTTQEEIRIPEDWTTGAHGTVYQPRRVRGLRMPVLPTGSWLAQVGGAVAGMTGVYMQFGVAVALIVGGVGAVVVGALREAGKI